MKIELNVIRNILRLKKQNTHTIFQSSTFDFEWTDKDEDIYITLQ